MIVHPSLGQAEEAAASFGPNFLGSVFYRSLDGVRVLTFARSGVADRLLDNLQAAISGARLRRLSKAAIANYDHKTRTRAAALLARTAACRIVFRPGITVVPR